MSLAPWQLGYHWKIFSIQENFNLLVVLIKKLKIEIENARSSAATYIVTTCGEIFLVT